MSGDLVARVAALGADRLALVLVRGLATAYAQQEWDSETIEQVMEQLVKCLPDGTPQPEPSGDGFWIEQARGVGLDVEDELPRWDQQPGCQ